MTITVIFDFGAVGESPGSVRTASVQAIAPLRATAWIETVGPDAPHSDESPFSDATLYAIAPGLAGRIRATVERTSGGVSLYRVNSKERAEHEYA